MNIDAVRVIRYPLLLPVLALVFSCSNAMSPNSPPSLSVILKGEVKDWSGHPVSFSIIRSSADGEPVLTNAYVPVDAMGAFEAEVSHTRPEVGLIDLYVELEIPVRGYSNQVVSSRPETWFSAGR